jgi:hypothetical protein
MGENRARASDSVIHPRSPTGRALSDADNASSSTALSLRASGGVDVPGANAALMVFHIPMTARYIAALQGTTTWLGSLEFEPLRHWVTILPRRRPVVEPVRAGRVAPPKPWCEVITDGRPLRRHRRKVSWTRCWKSSRRRPTEHITICAAAAAKGAANVQQIHSCEPKITSAVPRESLAQPLGQ